MTTVIAVERTLADGSTYRLGNAIKQTAGWRFIPTVSGRNTSRKAWPTWEACLPAGSVILIDAKLRCCHERRRSD